MTHEYLVVANHVDHDKVVRLFGPTDDEDTARRWLASLSRPTGTLEAVLNDIRLQRREVVGGWEEVS